MIKLQERLLKMITNRTVVLHLCCWSIFIVYELCFLYFTQLEFVSGTVFKFLVYYSVNVCLFYCHLGLLDEIFQTHRLNYAKGVVLLFLQLLAFMLIKAGLDIFFSSSPLTFNAMLAVVRTYVFVNFFRCIYFCVFATFYCVAGNIADYRKKAALSEKKKLIALKEKAEIETRFTQTRNAYLQQQLNPHLLFNALSFIYSSVYTLSAEGGRCVLLLSDIMRYSLEGSGKDGKTPLNRELEQVENLIEINRYRFDRELCLETRLDAGPEDARIIPLVLITLTENLFKHGQLNDTEHPALLEIRTDAQKLMTYYCRNRKKAKSLNQRVSALGLQNTHIRLEHSYPGLYQLDIKEDEQFYELTLTMQL
jgi:two-component system LytT family sensor kinase